MSHSMRNLLIRRGKRARFVVNNFLARYSRVANPPVFDPASFSWVAALEHNWEDIQREALSVWQSPEVVPLVTEISEDHRGLDPNQRWRSYFLWGYGYKVPENCVSCPLTTELAERVPGLLSAFYSILEPGAHLPRHVGVTKGIITCHLGLQIPGQPGCEIVVNGASYNWHPGKAFVFDDTYPHEVWNRTNETRLILLVQFRRPLQFPGSIMNSLFLNLIRFSPFVQDARRNIRTRRIARIPGERETGAKPVKAPDDAVNKPRRQEGKTKGPDSGSRLNRPSVSAYE